jgi:hypothetical protein
MLKKAIDLGGLLFDQKERVGHGNWLDWVKGNLSFSPREAQHYMRCYENRDQLFKEIKAKSISHLADAVKLLAKPKKLDKTPKPVEESTKTVEYSVEKVEEPPEKVEYSVRVMPEDTTKELEEQVRRVERVRAKNTAKNISMAIITDLEKINKDDPARIDEFKIVFNWIKKELGEEPNEAEKVHTPTIVSHVSTFVITHLKEVPTDNNEWRNQFEIIISWMKTKLNMPKDSQEPEPKDNVTIH